SSTSTTGCCPTESGPPSRPEVSPRALCGRANIRARPLRTHFGTMPKRLDRKPRSDSPANSVLAALPRKAYLALLPGLVPVALVFGDVLYEPGEVIRDVYFPGRSVVSLLTVVEGHPPLEVGLVGREGMVGIPLAPGIGLSPVR